LSWHHRLGFVDLVRLMVDAEMEQLRLQIEGNPQAAARTAF
jgi:hypothetical protein